MDRSARLARTMIAHLPALRRYALGLSGNQAAADDLVQDCIERGIRRLETLQDEGRMAAWLRSILFNIFVNERRQRRHRGDRVETDQLEHIADIRAGPDLQREADETLSAIAGLAVQYRQVLLLIGVEGLSYREAASELQIPIGTVMSRLARARDQLRAILSPGSPVGLGRTSTEHTG